MYIQTEATPNPATLKFLPGRVVMPEGTFEAKTPEQGEVSPLAERLFAVLVRLDVSADEKRRAGHEMLHDGAEDRGLEVLPLAGALRHRHEVVAEEHARHAGHLEQALGER